MISLLPRIFFSPSLTLLNQLDLINKNIPARIKIYYALNILKLLQKNYRGCQDSKKKITEAEIAFAEKLVKQIDQFCGGDSNLLYQKFKASKLSQAEFIRKHKVSRQQLRSAITKAETETKYDSVKRLVKEDFSRSRSEGKEVHRDNLRRLAKLKAKELGVKKKCGSIAFTDSIKRKYRIVSRRSTVKKILAHDEAATKQAAANFVSRVNEFVAANNIQPSRIFNADQKGLRYEPHTKRTLEFKNTKHVFSTAVRESDTTHSYTLQIYMNQAGKLGKTMFMVLQERDGLDGPKVSRKIRALQETCNNVLIASSRSGKLDLGLLERWVAMFKLENGINERASDPSVLLWDDYSPQRSKRFDIQDRFSTHTMPPKTTRYCQPLDARFNLQYQLFYNSLFSELKFLIKVDRFYIIKLNSIIYNQLSHSKFEDLVRFSFVACKFEGVDCEGFKSVNQLCFADLDECSLCDQEAVMKCLYCEKDLCYNHLIISEVHLHL